MATGQLEDDLAFVRRIAEQSDRRRSPAAIYLIWAAISLIGFPMIDHAPQHASLFWAIASPAGAIASFVVGARGARAAGQVSREQGRRHALHWLGMLAAAALASGLVFTGRIDMEAFGPLMLLLIAFGYFLGGVHLDPPLLWIGVLIAVLYVVVLFFVTRGVWTIVGVALAAALSAAAVASWRSRGVAATH